MARSLNDNGAGAGHNSGGMVDGASLRRFVERVCSLMEDRDVINGDIKEVYEEAKSAGFVTKHLRQLCREQRMDQDELRDHLQHMQALRSALGEFSSTPLGEAAVERGAAHPLSKLSKPRRQDRPPRSQEAIEQAQAHLAGDAAAAMDEDLDRIIAG